MWVLVPSIVAVLIGFGARVSVFALLTAWVILTISLIVIDYNITRRSR